MSRVWLTSINIDPTGSFEIIDTNLIKGRSRFAQATATKDKIRALGVECV